jgi:hypothetical protein
VTVVRNPTPLRPVLCSLARMELLVRDFVKDALYLAQRRSLILFSYPDKEVFVSPDRTANTSD